MADQDKGHISGHYLSRSWALLTRDSGWLKPVLVLSLVALVPIIGPIAVIGYGLEWARLTAWGVDAAPKQKRVNIRQVLMSGWRGFVVGLVWEFAIWVVYAVVSWAFGHTPGDGSGFLPGGLIDALYSIACLVLSPVVIAAQIRSAVYQRIGAGLRADRVLQMCFQDFGDLIHMFGMQLLGWLVLLCLGVAFGAVVLAIVAPYIVGLGYSSSALLPGSRALGSFIAGILGSLSIPIVLFGFCTSVVMQVTRLLCMTGVGLWMRQFDVSRWGRSADPLPGRDGSKEGTRDGSSDTDAQGSAALKEGPARVASEPDDLGAAAATRTTTTIVREPGKRPVIETKTEAITDRGVIYQGSTAHGGEDGEIDDAGSSAPADDDPTKAL